MHDFTAQANDIIKQVYFSSSGSWASVIDVVVYSVDTVFLGGKYRRVLRVGENYSNWIEGIGSDYGLFSETLGNVSGNSSRLYCSSIGDSTVFPQYEEGLCNIYIGLNENDKISLTASPNPTTDLLFLEGGDFSSNPNIAVYSIIGNKVSVLGKYTTNRMELDFSSLPNGIYLLTLESKNRTFSRKIMKQ